MTTSEIGWLLWLSLEALSTADGEAGAVSARTNAGGCPMGTGSRTDGFAIAKSKRAIAANTPPPSWLGTAGLAVGSNVLVGKSTTFVKVPRSRSFVIVSGS